MGNGVNPIPEGFHTVTPYMTIKDAASAIEFYKAAFGATEIFRWADPDGRIRHAEASLSRSWSIVTRNSEASPGSSGGR